MTSPSHDAEEAWAEDAPTSGGRRLLHVAVALVVIFVAGLLATWMLNTVPKSRRRKRPEYATLVQTKQFTYSQTPIVIEAMGVVKAAREVTLFPRVRGEVVGVNKALLPGGLFRKGRTMLRIDSRDYHWVVKQRQAALAQAKATLALERGRQAIARREYAMVDKRKAAKNLALMLRKPQLETAKANIQAAKAQLAMARLNYRRTLIRAPFDAIILERLIHGGSRVTETTSLLRLAGTKRFWVEVAVAVDQLRWLKIPRKDRAKGSVAQLQDPDAWGPGVHRKAHVLRLFPAVETQGRMARLLLEVEDPLCLKKKHAKVPRLLLGSYINARITGKLPPRTIRLPRRYLRDQNTIWLLSPKNTLDIRPVSILHRAKEYVLIQSGLTPQDRLITTLLPTPVKGMALRTKASMAKRKQQRRKKRRKQ